jgi:hypothetical protein
LPLSGEQVKIQAKIDSQQPTILAMQDAVAKLQSNNP